MRLAELAARLGCRLDGDPEIEVTGVGALDDAGPGALTFLADHRHAAKLETTRATAVIVATDHPPLARPTLRAPHPYLAFVGAIELLHPPGRPAAGVHPTAVIAPGASLGPGAHVGPHVVVGDGVVIGRDAVLHARVVIGAGATIGEGFTAQAGAVVCEGVRIGSRVVLHCGAVVGSDGFGFLPLPDGPRKIPQIGTVIIEDDVEIGANSTIDRAALGETRVGRGTKIDNLVHVAHGCRIGPQCLIAAQVGLSGGTTLGRGVMLGGQVGSAGHLTIGDGARVAAQSGVHRDIGPGGVQAGYPAVDARLWRRTSSAVARLPALLRRVRRIERHLRMAPAREDTD